MNYERTNSAHIHSDSNDQNTQHKQHWKREIEIVSVKATESESVSVCVYVGVLNTDLRC